MRNVVKSLLGKKANKHIFEESGNYVFTISRREIEKVALGLNYKAVAFKGVNDVYLPGVDSEKMSDNGPLQKKLTRLIGVANILSKLRLMDYNLLVTIIFKKELSKELFQKLVEEGYEVIQLPDNPYITG